MEPGRSIQQMKLRAFDLSERTGRLSRRSAKERWDRLRARWFLIAQCAVTAGVAWFVSAEVLDHPAPAFGPIAAVICLGVTYGQRLRRGVDVAIGVAVGIAVGDLFVLGFGTGTWQVIVVVALSMTLATLLGARQLMIIQAAVQSIVVTTLIRDPARGFDRWLDAVIGCALALLMASIAPGAPLRRPGTIAAEILIELAATLEAAESALRRRDSRAADAVLQRARSAEIRLATLDDAANEGLAVARQSVFRRHQLSTVQAYADLQVPLDRASRNLRVLVRRCAAALWRAEPVPENYLRTMADVASVARLMARQLFQGRIPSDARDQLVEVAERTSHLDLHQPMSTVVILAQLRSILVDLLELTGMNAADAREMIPEMD
jgi:uncharacterized membrane protein YgaE (UPF0421/DUF939 family)